MNWIISANSSMYDHSSSFEHHGFIDWRQGKNKFNVGDTVYIYCNNPIKKIRYKCIIEKHDMDFESIRDDKEYWLMEDEYYKSLDGKFMRLRLIEQVDNDKLSLNQLKKNGLKAAPQGPVKLSDKILDYINSNFNEYHLIEIFPDTIESTTEVYEGIKKQITVNKYERSSIARAKCIEYHGTKCKVCNIDFAKKYGDIGIGFIHVHHIIPIHRIGKEYQIDYKNDLIPVCPNCHAMLHKKYDDNYLSIEELKAKIK